MSPASPARGCHELKRDGVELRSDRMSLDPNFWKDSPKPDPDLDGKRVRQDPHWRCAHRTRLGMEDLGLEQADGTPHERCDVKLFYAPIFTNS